MATFNFLPQDHPRDPEFQISLHPDQEEEDDAGPRLPPAPFCTSDTWETALQQFNLHLTRRDLPQLRLRPQTMTDEEMAEILNTVAALLEDHGGNSRSSAGSWSRPEKGDEEQQIARLESDLQSAETQIADLRFRLRKEEKAVFAAEQRGLQRETELRSKLRRLEQRNSELEKAQIRLARRDHHWQLELRKQKLQTQKLQDRLSRALSERSRDSKLRFQLLNPVTPNRSAAQHPPNPASETALLRQTMQGYRNRLSIAEEETQQHRDALAHISEELLETLVQQGGAPDTGVEYQSGYDACIARLNALNETLYFKAGQFLFVCWGWEKEAKSPVPSME